MELRPGGMVHQGKQRPAQQAPRSGIPQRGRLAQHEQGCRGTGRTGWEVGWEGKDGMWFTRGLLQDEGAG